MSELGQKLVEIVRRKAAENPDYVYQAPGDGIAAQCLYVHDGKPSCLIGQALLEAGVIGPDFEANADNRRGFRSLWHHIPSLQALSYDEYDWLQSVQRRQDAGEPWANAVAFADHHSSPLYR